MRKTRSTVDPEDKANVSDSTSTSSQDGAQNPPPKEGNDGSKVPPPKGGPKTKTLTTVRYPPSSVTTGSIRSSPPTRRLITASSPLTKLTFLLRS